MQSNIFKMIKAKAESIALLALLLLLILSFHLHKQEFENTVGAPNLEATYHVLLTVTALSESSINNHYLLPTVTLGQKMDKGIPWGATVPTLTGDYIYTSFTSAGFLAPYIWFKLLGQQPTIENLARFNFILGSVAAVILYFFLISALRFYGASIGVAALSALAAISIGIFSREALLSHGIIYWAQSLYQVVLISSMFLVFKLLYKTNQKSPTYISSLIIILSFIGALLEWTGFIFNTGLSIVLWYASDKDVQARRSLALNIFMSTILAGVFILTHYGFAVGFEPAIHAFISRFEARNTVRGNLFALLQGYVLSYGLFIPFLFGLLVVSRNLHNGGNLNQRRVMWWILAVSCIPLLENILMLQHATQFSFDRLKFILPASIGIAFCLARLDTKSRAICMIIIMGISVHSYAMYKEDLKQYAAWQGIDEKNRQLKDMITAYPLSECAIYASNINVRGYANLLFHRGIYEYKTQKDINGLVQSQHACAGIFIESTKAFSDLPKYTSATITHLDGSMKTFTVDK